MQQLTAVAVFTAQDFERDCDPTRFSIYRDVIVFWDPDDDPRVLDVIDDLVADGKAALLAAASERKGVLTLWWLAEARPLSAPMTVEPGGDEWQVVHRLLRPDTTTRRLVVREVRP